jgi:hypothetical protein
MSLVVGHVGEYLLIIRKYLLQFSERFKLANGVDQVMKGKKIDKHLCVCVKKKGGLHHLNLSSTEGLGLWCLTHHQVNKIMYVT